MNLYWDRFAKFKSLACTPPRTRTSNCSGAARRCLTMHAVLKRVPGTIDRRGLADRRLEGRLGSSDWGLSFNDAVLLVGRVPLRRKILV